MWVYQCIELWRYSDRISRTKQKKKQATSWSFRVRRDAAFEFIASVFRPPRKRRVDDTTRIREFRTRIREGTVSIGQLRIESKQVEAAAAATARFYASVRIMKSRACIHMRETKCKTRCTMDRRKTSGNWFQEKIEASRTAISCELDTIFKRNWPLC